MKNKQKNFFSRHLDEIKDTIFPFDENDSPGQRRVKKLGWVMFLILMSCGLLAMLVAVSFAH
ncbi:hypothetical protein SMI01S_24490 [Sphingobacterium mizutaii NBRC 14946 = DSM 11724]|uniref:Uncharacterized protein n=2 Tax=Sphingobacterium mizutaii TaxID=1010 RepID=A0AAJ5C087_9SPHI|nr:hypothetical protein [Sphingobacterium mizutaii]GEM68843.1 hypothetical protein SMI01S_24490 [Sphingobacterium mizutaii NBRC 14946 = DSM 11724]SDL01040.1 hypothetical protein SAMN05192578_101827 [Sphingobacterium mizutaii]SNV50050.1 Uncharacterised protein [Sphingobacterium mizutaii]